MRLNSELSTKVILLEGLITSFPCIIYNYTKTNTKYFWEKNNTKVENNYWFTALECLTFAKMLSDTATACNYLLLIVKPIIRWLKIYVNLHQLMHTLLVYGIEKINKINKYTWLQNNNKLLFLWKIDPYFSTYHSLT